MTEFFPEGVSTLGKETVIWVPDLADPNAPTVTELTGASAINLSFAARGFSPTGDQPATQDIRLGTKVAGEAAGRASQSIDDITYVYDPQLVGATTPNPEVKHYDSMEPGMLGYLVDRRGLDAETVAVAADQVADVYRVELGERRPVAVDATGDGGQKFEYTQKPFVVRKYSDVKIVAGV